MDEWQIIIYIPTFNAESTIMELVKRIDSTTEKLPAICLKSLIIIDDGSTDRTSQIIESLKKELPYILHIRKNQNEGPTPSLFTGMHAASEEIKDKENTIVIRMDSDLEHQPENIPKLIRPIMEGKTKISAGYIPFDSRSGESAVAKLKEMGLQESREFLGMDIPQFCPGFNALRGDIFLELVPKLDGLREEFQVRYSKDMLTIDFVLLVIAKKLGEEIAIIKLSSIEDRWIKKIPIRKLLGYLDYHNKTIDFLKR